MILLVYKSYLVLASRQFIKKCLQIKQQLRAMDFRHIFTAIMKLDHNWDMLALEIWVVFAI